MRSGTLYASGRLGAMHLVMYISAYLQIYRELNRTLMCFGVEHAASANESETSYSGIWSGLQKSKEPETRYIRIKSRLQRFGQGDSGK